MRKYLIAGLLVWLPVGATILVIKFLVDTMDGEMHRAYGGWPNMVYVINPQGRVIYRCDWAFPHLIKRALDSRNSLHTREHQPIITAPLHIMVPVVLRGGWDALWDLVIALPVLTFKHLQQDVRPVRPHIDR